MITGIVGLLVAAISAGLTVYSYNQVDKLFTSPEPATDAELEKWHMAYTTWIVALTLFLILTAASFTLGMNLIF